MIPNENEWKKKLEHLPKNVRDSILKEFTPKFLLSTICKTLREKGSLYANQNLLSYSYVDDFYMENIEANKSIDVKTFTFNLIDCLDYLLNNIDTLKERELNYEK